MEREIPSQSNLETFGALIRDHRLSHGAFRLWHALRDYTDHASKCFPGQRRLAADIGCNLHSLKPWTEELTSAGWLAVSTSGIGEGFTYTVLDGNGRPLRKVATPTVAENRNTPIANNGNTPVAESGNGPLRKVATKVRSPFKSVHLSKERTRFSKPTLEQVKLESAKIGLHEIEAEKFFHYYEANGWRTGKNPMRSWTHALSGWKLRSQSYHHQKPTPPPTTPTRSVLRDGLPV
jgi:hypothetical protein